MTPSNLCVAVLGTGALGTAVGQRLLGLGFNLRLFNRTPAKAALLTEAGGSAFPTAAEAIKGADYVLTLVTDARALRAVLFEAARARDCDWHARAFIDLGTHSPRDLAAIALDSANIGINLIEAPVTGSVHDALSGTLNFLVGGDVATVQEVRPFLETIGRAVYYFGPVGSGNTAKLALNLLVAAMAFGMGESIAMLRAAGLDNSLFLDALAHSPLSSPFYERLGHRYLQHDVATRFSLMNLEKDVIQARDRAAELGLRPVLASAMADALRALEPDVKQKDYSTLITALCNES